MRTYQIGRLGDVWVTATPLFLISSIMVWAILALVGVWLLSLSLSAGILLGLMGTVLHWLSDLAHQLGHAWAAQSVGFPMREFRFHFLLVRTYYPNDEPSLPPQTHIRRALGGPPISLLLSVMGVLFVLLLRPIGGPWYWLALFFFLENFFVFFLGAFVPVPGFTDGGTLLEWWPRRRQ